MLSPERPDDEDDRLRRLHRLNLLDRPPDERLDRLTRLAVRLFRVPTALVSLVDAERQWFASRVGLDVAGTARDVSFCGHAILQDRAFVVPDATLDPRFADNPMVTGAPQVRFYAGCPLVVDEGARLGTLCLVDREPRAFYADDVDLLERLGAVAARELHALRMATLDELTGLSNRRDFVRLGSFVIETCGRQARAAALTRVDLALAPIENDFGSAEADRAAVRFAGLLTDAYRESDLFGSIARGVFVVLRSDEGADAAIASRRALERAVAVERLREDRGYPLRFEVRRVPFDPPLHASVESMLREADRARRPDRP